MPSEQRDVLVIHQYGEICIKGVTSVIDRSTEQLTLTRDDVVLARFNHYHAWIYADCIEKKE